MKKGRYLETGAALFCGIARAKSGKNAYLAQYTCGYINHSITL